MKGRREGGKGRKRDRKERGGNNRGQRREEEGEGREEERELGWQKFTLPYPASSQSLICSWQVSGRASCTPASEHNHDMCINRSLPFVS